MRFTGAEITRIVQAFAGAPNDPPPALMKRRQRNALWTSWAGRAYRLVRTEFEGLQEAGRAVIQERDEALAEMRLAREPDAKIREAEKQYHAELAKLDKVEADIPIEPYRGIMKDIELSPEERANLGKLLPDVLRGVDDVEESGEEEDAAA